MGTLVYYKLIFEMDSDDVDGVTIIDQLQTSVSKLGFNTPPRLIVVEPLVEKPVFEDIQDQPPEE